MEAIRSLPRGNQYQAFCALLFFERLQSSLVQGQCRRLYQLLRDSLPVESLHRCHNPHPRRYHLVGSMRTPRSVGAGVVHAQAWSGLRQDHNTAPSELTSLRFGRVVQMNENGVSSLISLMALFYVYRSVKSIIRAGRMSING